MKSRLARSLAAVALFAAPAAADDRCRLPFFPRIPHFRFHAPRFSFEFGACQRPIHRHDYVVRCDRVWVEPCFEERVVGYDLCGRPIVRRILVRAGHWTVVRYRVCACGDRIDG